MSYWRGHSDIHVQTMFMALHSHEHGHDHGEGVGQDGGE